MPQRSVKIEKLINRFAIQLFMKRLFAAIKITPHENFLKIYYRLLKSFDEDRIKWVETNNLHITLKFFGETSEDSIDPICEVISKVSDTHIPFQFIVKDIGIFGSSYNPRVIWFGIEKNESIKSLGIDIHKSLESIGFTNERQNFVPHLTVGRIKEIKHKRSFQQRIDRFKGFHIQVVDVKELFLFESVLTSSGPVYEVIERFPL